MNLTNLELVARIKQLALEERRVTLALIEHLEEMERRKLHLELGFGSLYDYCPRARHVRRIRSPANLGDAFGQGGS